MSDLSSGSGRTSNLPSGANLSLSDKQVQTWVWIGILTAIVVASYWNSLWALAGEWQQPEYSHGYLIPVFAAVLLWMRREPFPDDIPASDRWWGVGLLTLGIVLRVLGTMWVLFTVDYISLIPSIMGVFVLVGGLRALRWAAAPIAFLIFMYPLPGFMKDNLLRPLQEIATRWSVYLMQTVGMEVYRDGNRIHLEQMDLNVVDACSGLRMLTIFTAMSVAIVLVIVVHRPWWERLIILVSAIPIALAVNILRITITGMLYSLNVKKEIAEAFFHGGAGLVMMPMAMGFLFLEVWILSKLFIEPETASVASMRFVPKTPTVPQMPRGG